MKLYGYLPTKYAELKTFDLNWNGGDLGTQTISSSQDDIVYYVALARLNTALGLNTSGDLGVTTSNNRLLISSASGKAFTITNWKSRGFFGFDYRIDQNNGLGGVPGGLQVFEGLTLEKTTTATASEIRETYGDQYHHHQGRIHSLSGYVRPENLRTSHMGEKGMMVDPGWAAWKGKCEITDPDSSNSGTPWSFGVPDGYIEGHLYSFEVRGKFNVNGAELFEVGLEISN